MGWDARPDVRRYGTPSPGKLLLFPYEIADGKAALIAPTKFEAEFPRCWHYLKRSRKVLESREGGKFDDQEWYRFGRTQNLALHDHRKLAVPRLVEHLKAVYDSDGSIYLDNVDVGGILLKDASQGNHLYILGLLQSRLLDYCFQRISAPFRGGFRSANRQFIEPLPMRRIDASNQTDVALRDEIVTLVEKMLQLQAEMDGVSPYMSEKQQEMEKNIRRTDAELDEVVFRLYGLTDDEKKRIIERQ